MASSSAAKLGAHLGNESKLERGLEGSQRYASVTTQCFTKKHANYATCMLCNWTARRHTFDRHIVSPWHSQKYEHFKSTLLSQVPKLTSLQMNSVKEFLVTSYYNNCLDNGMYQLRDNVLWQFENLLRTIDPQCSCRAIGSHMTRTSLVSSNLNIEVIHPNSKLFKKDPRSKYSIHHKLVDPEAGHGSQFNYHTLEYDLISNAYQTLHDILVTLNNPYSDYSNIFKIEGADPIKDLNSKVPKVLLNHVPSATRVELCCYNEFSYKLSGLLKAYLMFDYRARDLARLVKYWAHICKIDNPNHGTFPPETFIILVIYFLQRTSPPVLPCLHDMYPKFSMCEKSRLMQDNSREMLSKFKNIDINDGNSSLKRDIQESTNMENGLETGEDDAFDEEEEDEMHIDSETEEVKDLLKHWSSKNGDPVHLLFIQFLKSMMNEFDCQNNVITIRTLEKVSLTSKNWPTMIKPIENPIRPRINICRCIGSRRTFEYIKNCFDRGFYYLTSVPIDLRLKRRFENHVDPQDFIKLYYNIDRLDSYFNMRWSHGTVPRDTDTITEMINQGLFERDVKVINALFDQARAIQATPDHMPRYVANAYDKSFLIPSDSDGAIFCWLCKTSGHSKEDCSRGIQRPLSEEWHTYDLQLDHDANLDSVFIALFQRDSISQRLTQTHQNITNEIAAIVNGSIKGYEFRFSRYGSTVNNLGSIDSDLDICMTLTNNPKGRSIDCVEILRGVHEILSTHDEVKKLESVLTARVPIIRFTYRNFDVDLSMYNQCALYNSELFRTYSLVDERVPMLVYLVKRMAKSCGIADASRGSLSSYAWSLLVIHYLQQTDPPVVPVLQETESGIDPPKFGVSGWNVWFRRDLSSFKRLNELTLTQLFKDFLLYYSNYEFHYHVISIRRSTPLYRTQKSWNSSMIAIEDPFELTYNLANRLDEPMAIYIINAFKGGFRHLLRTQKYYKESKPTRKEVERFLFDGRKITGEDPPFNRGCKICHRIGHKMKDCPEKREKTSPNPKVTNGI